MQLRFERRVQKIGWIRLYPFHENRGVRDGMIELVVDLMTKSMTWGQIGCEFQENFVRCFVDKTIFTLRIE